MPTIARSAGVERNRRPSRATAGRARSPCHCSGHPGWRTWGNVRVAREGDWGVALTHRHPPGWGGTTAGTHSGDVGARDVRAGDAGVGEAGAEDVRFARATSKGPWA